MKKLLTTGAAVLAAFAALAEDAYIESNGANTINTGYYANPKTKLVVDFKLTEVKTGLSDGLQVQILSGLQEGDTVWYSYYDTLEIKGLPGGFPTA